MADIITLAEYKSFNKLVKDDLDDKYTFLISAVSEIIRAYLDGSVFAPSGQITEYISVDYDTDRIFPKYWPIRNIVSIEEPDRYTWDSTVHVPLQVGTEYYLDGDSIVRVPENGFANWPISPATVKLVYEAGYDTDAGGSPADVKLAAIELVNYYVNKEHIPNRSIQGTTIINAGSTVADLPAHVRAILDQYKG